MPKRAGTAISVEDAHTDDAHRTGDLHMNGHTIRGLSTEYPPPEVKDLALSFYQITRLFEDATEKFIVSKKGDTMAGDLDMTGHRVKHLPLDPVDTSDACSAAFVIREGLRIAGDTLSRDGAQPMMGHLDMGRHYVKHALDPSEPQDVATKKYVDSRKPLIAVWAEENGSIDDGENEWSFGNGASGQSHSRSGYAMPAAGRVLRMGLATSSDVGGPAVDLVINGARKPGNFVSKPSGSYSTVCVFERPLELRQGDRVNFRSTRSAPRVESAVVNVLIELDL